MVTLPNNPKSDSSLGLIYPNLFFRGRHKEEQFDPGKWFIWNYLNYTEQVNLLLKYSFKYLILINRVIFIITIVE